MGVRFRSTFTGAQFSEAVASAVQVAMEDTVDVTVDQIKDWISTRGIKKPGRIETRRWVDSIFGGVTRNGSVITGGVGDEHSQTESGETWYMALQDEGFTHYLTGERIPAVGAFLDAYPFMENELNRRLSQRLGAVLRSM